MWLTQLAACFELLFRGTSTLVLRSLRSNSMEIDPTRHPKSLRPSVVNMFHTYSCWCLMRNLAKTQTRAGVTPTPAPSERIRGNITSQQAPRELAQNWPGKVRPARTRKPCSDRGSSAVQARWGGYKGGPERGVLVLCTYATRSSLIGC